MAGRFFVKSRPFELQASCAAISFFALFNRAIIAISHHQGQYSSQTSVCQEGIPFFQALGEATLFALGRLC
jgi:hypothetical protein